MSIRELPSTYPPMDLRPTPPKALRRGPFAAAGFVIKCLSRSDLKRPPPGERKTKHLRLITSPVSHYCEKARWGLDLLEQDSESPYYYTEDGHCPPFLAFETVPASGGKVSASPMVVYPDGSYVAKSDAILREHCPFLYPDEVADRVRAVEDDLAVRVGASVRCVVYHQMLQRPYVGVLCDMFSRNTSRIERKLLPVLMERGVARGMRKVIRVNQESYDASLPVLRQAFSDLSDVLSDGREYVCDEHIQGGKKAPSHGFTAADLTLAALAAPLLQPPCYNSTFGVATDRLPPEIQALQAELRNTRAGRHAMNMYEKHRPTVNGSVLFKSSSRRDQIDWRRVLPVAALSGAVAVAAVSAVVGRLS
jgi:glutathione S-transferase